MPATLTDNALAVLRARYLVRENGVVVETPDQLFRRVATHIAAVESQYGATPDEVQAWRTVAGVADAARILDPMLAVSSRLSVL